MILHECRKFEGKNRLGIDGGMGLQRECCMFDVWKCPYSVSPFTWDKGESFEISSHSI